MLHFNPRNFIKRSAICSGGLALGLYSCVNNNDTILKGVQDFLNNVANPDGSWYLWEPDWDVHACFDALFILRQLADQTDPKIQEAYKEATNWILSCRKPGGGFTHIPDMTHSDVDAVYFHVGGLVETGYLKVRKNLENEEILGWGHAMNPEKRYSCID